MKKIFSLLLALAMVLSFAACGAQSTELENAVPAAPETEAASAPASAAKPATDPSGAPVDIPDEIDSIISLSPAAAEVIIELGCGDKIIACDTNSTGLKGMPEGIPAFDLMQPDMEMLSSLKPDVLVVSNLTLYDEKSPYRQLTDMGVCVLNIPSANSIAEIISQIQFIGDAMGKSDEGRVIADNMQAQLDSIAEKAKTITDKKTVYFEIGAAPSMYSFGSNVFLNEMIELIGAENILADQEGWLPVEGETVAAANPDVILTNVNYIEDSVGEILSRSGWEGMKAIENKDVYYIDNMASSLGNQNIITALQEMAEAVYPDIY
ncbi:MAG: ABC transporter substrate-binding protein [Candidatus Limivicinus sp.]|jgi:iron complex transport system substrate-binding protein